MFPTTDAAEAATISPRSLAKQLNIGNTAAIERRIKRELEENGNQPCCFLRVIVMILSVSGGQTFFRSYFLKMCYI